MDFQVGDEFAVPGLEEHVTVMTQVQPNLLIKNYINQKFFLQHLN